MTLDEAQKELEKSLVALRDARDGQGRLVRLGGATYKSVVHDFEMLCRWFSKDTVFIEGDAGKAAALRNLSLLCAAYRSYMQYFAVGGTLPPEPVFPGASQ